MPESAVFDVIIGLVLTYFLLGLVCSGLNEAAAGLFNLRGKFLSEYLERMLGSSIKDRLYEHHLIRSLSAPEPPAYLPDAGKKLREERRKPAYISSGTFAEALQSVVVSLVPPADAKEAETLTVERITARLSAIPDEGFRSTLESLLASAQGDVQEWKARIERWFEDSMGRISGWYKRRIKWWLALFALVVTLGLNADSVLFATTLWREEAIRASVVSRVGSAGDPDTSCPDSTQDPLGIDCVTDRIDDAAALKLPLGWSTDADDPRIPNGIGEISLKVLGWTITFVALLKGAPFWFDALNRLGNLRASGRPPRGSGSPGSEGTAVRG